MERPQNIEALIPARLKRWHVQDGQTVKKGELIVELSEIDQKYLDPNQSQRLDQQRSLTCSSQSGSGSIQGAGKTTQ